MFVYNYNSDLFFWTSRLFPILILVSIVVLLFFILIVLFPLLFLVIIILTIFILIIFIIIFPIHTIFILIITALNIIIFSHNSYVIPPLYFSSSFIIIIILSPNRVIEYFTILQDENRTTNQLHQFLVIVNRSKLLFSHLFIPCNRNIPPV